MKKKLAATLSVVLILGMAVLGILAYLSDTDSDVNVMTLGEVSITQNEQQRVEKDGQFTSELEDFEQEKILMPVTYPDGRSADTVKIGDYTVELSDDEANYVDKIISVTNDGESEAYVRTLVAVPTGGEDWEQTPVAAKDCWLHWNIPAEYATYWTLNSPATFVEIDGIGYYVWEFVHKEALASGKTTYPMVRGFYMDQKVDNDDNGFYMTYADGTTKRIDDFTAEDTVDILVVSQAVQTEGFADAQTALDTAFGDITAENHPWVDGIKWPGYIYSADEAYDISLESGEYVLDADYKTSDANNHFSVNREYAIKGTDYTIDLNGHTITHDGTYQDGKNTGYTYLYTTASNGKLTINGEGTINSENIEGFVCIAYAQESSEIVINGGNFNTVRGIPVWAGNGSKVTINGGSFISTGSNDQELIYSSGGVIDIYGGFFHNTEQDNRPVNVANRNRGTGFINIYGGTFVNFDPSTGGDDPDNIKVMEGYKVVSETQANGDIWYTVVAE